MRATSSGSLENARSAESDRILVVRHGPRRGPHVRCRSIRPRYFDPIVDDLRRRHPAVARRLQFWDTGAPAADLRRVSAILFLLQDPLRELFPECYRECVALADRARDQGVRVINPPEVLSNSTKCRQSELWRTAGFHTPNHRGFRNHEQLREVARQVSFPAIVRADLHHTQKGMILCATHDELERIPADQLTYPGTLSELIDTREGYRHTAPGTPWAEFYHKKRAMVFGNTVVNNHVFFSRNPIVGSRTSTFGHYRSLNPIHRWRSTRRCREHIAIDCAFFQSPAEQSALLRDAARVLGMKWAAIDYSTSASGTVVLWETNPYFGLQLWPLEILGGPRRVRERQRHIHDAIAAFLEEL